MALNIFYYDSPESFDWSKRAGYLKQSFYEELFKIFHKKETDSILKSIALLSYDDEILIRKTQIKKLLTDFQELLVSKVFKESSQADFFIKILEDSISKDYGLMIAGDMYPDLSKKQLSLNYTLEINEKRNLVTLAKRLGLVSGYQMTSEGITAPGMWISVDKPGPLRVEMIEDELGFTPNTSIMFRLDKEAEPVATHVSLLQGCMDLLSGGAGDAALLFNGETVIFLRRNGRLTFNLLEGFWTDEVLAILPTSREFESIRHL